MLSLVDGGDDDKFTPTKHLTPPPHHSSRPAAAHTETETRREGGDVTADLYI